MLDRRRLKPMMEIMNRLGCRSFSVCWLLACLGALSSSVAAGDQPQSQTDWPEFRGPTGDGNAPASATGLPLHWSETENVKWKTPLPYRGWSTPVVMNGQVWATTATEDGHDFHAICVDAATGKVRFNEKVFHCDKPEPLGNDVNCYATPSAF